MNQGNALFKSRGCHKVGTDALVCPPKLDIFDRKNMSLGQYVLMLSVLKPQCETDRRGRLSLLVVLSSYAKSTIYPPLHSERGRG
ncbi:hypothetical protein HMPREF0973_00488 [Prevotella veroralis F0319]|uniref:Uncharacterized protein n=1 Tax=Prevotella veroralis F0319 TaxID=649761 RepID=C9MLL4_9BACT|nr:hypothetical protein HMPREF0973_00488 [Prevotella veroralis F0319]